MKALIKRLLRENLDENIITKVINQWVKFYEEKEGMDPCSINTGECMNFAEAVYADLLKHGINAEIIDDAFFYDPFDDDPEQLANPEQFGGRPTFDYKEIGLPAHAWIYYKGKSYDSEAPEGVNNFFDLPIIANFGKRI